MSVHNGPKMPVEAFLKHNPDTERADYLLDYPGIRPAYSFISDGENISMLPDDYDEFTSQVNQLLARTGLPLLEERVPVLAYGANASPDRLRTKMAKYGDAEQQVSMQVVPHFAVDVPDLAAVWHGRPGQTGSVFAELYNGPEAKQGSMRAHVQFLTQRQLMAIHASEGATYSAALLPLTVGDTAKPQQLEAIAYVALESQVFTINGEPIAVQGIPYDQKKLKHLPARRVVTSMMYSAGEFPSSGDDQQPADFVKDGLALNVAERRHRQQVIGAKLTDLGVSRPFMFYDLSVSETIDNLIGRADFASLPGAQKHVYQIPEMLRGTMRPSSSTLAKKMFDLQQTRSDDTSEQLRNRALDTTDLARIVSRRAHDELAIRLRLQS